MPLSRAEIQRRYREKKKRHEGEDFLEKERGRQKQYYKPVSRLTESDRKERNRKSNARVQKHRVSKKRLVLNETDSDDMDVESSSGYSTMQSSETRLVVKFPARRNGPKKRLARALKTANEKLRKVIKQNIDTNKKVKRLQRRLQRQSKLKGNVHKMTPRRKTAAFMASSSLKGERIRRQLLFGNVILHQMKQANDKGNKRPNRGWYSAFAGGVVKKYRCISKLANELNVNRQKLSKVIKTGIAVPRKRRRTIEKLKESVTQFFEREDNCRTQPGKRDATKSGDGKVQTRILTDYMANLHQKYQAEQPDHKLSLATFCRMRPKHVHLTSCLSRNVCLCTKHQNFALKLQMMRKGGIELPQNPETFIESDVTIEKAQLPEEVVYSKWKRVTLENNKKKMKIVTESMDREKFYEEWLKEVEVFKMHYKTMKTQYRQSRILKEDLPQNEIVIHMDFAENYGCKTADEIQSAYWNSSQVTLHPMVIYYRDEDGALQHKSYVAVSDTMSHSSGTVLAILQKLFDQEIDLPGCGEIQYVHYWTDSPTSQYRNRYIFSAIINHEEVFGCEATWNYYESGHGKNVCDGLGGTVKRLADEAVRSGKSTIQDADDFMAWAVSSTMKGVKFFFITKDECEDMTIKLQQVELAPVKGTLQLHAVKINNERKLCTRNMSCYCNTCINGLMCDTWVVLDTNKSRKRKVEDYSTTNFVAALYEAEWYVGKILEVDPDDEGLDYKITFMQKRKSLYQWPHPEDVVWRKRSHILCKITSPVASGKSLRMFKLSESDLAEIEKCFQKQV